MVPGEVSSFISKARARNLSEYEIKEKLTTAGWSDDIVSEALDDLVVPRPHSSSHTTGNKELVESENGSSMWDAFEHILLFISLYVLATSVALILHYFV